MLEVSEMRSDDRVECRHCGRRMVPRIITERGSLVESVCPFCGGVYLTFDRPLSFLQWLMIAVLAFGCLVSLLLAFASE